MGQSKYYKKVLKLSIIQSQQQTLLQRWATFGLMPIVSNNRGLTLSTLI